MRNFRIYGLCAVAATALLMAGCGGGGSNTQDGGSASASVWAAGRMRLRLRRQTGTIASTGYSTRLPAWRQTGQHDNGQSLSRNGGST